MAHERTELRAAVVAQLKGPLNNRTSAGARVYSSRTQPLKVGDLPAILVFTPAESISEGSGRSAPRELKRTAEVRIEGWVMTAPGTAIADSLDALALQIETAMDLDQGIRSSAEITAGSSGYAVDSVLTDTEIEFGTEGEQVMGMVALTYACTYNTAIRNALPTADLALAGVQTSIDGDQATADQAGDLVTIPTE